MSNYRGGTAQNGQFMFSINGVGTFDVFFGQGPGQYLRYGSVDADLVPANEWHHIAFSYDERRGEGHKIKIYIDGSEISRYSIETEGTGGPILQSSDRLRIMADQVGGCHSSGIVDEVMLFNRALSDAEVAQLCGLSAARPKEESRPQQSLSVKSASSL